MKEQLIASAQKLAVTTGDLDINLAPKTSDPKQALLNVGIYLLWFVGAIALIYLVWGGLKFIMSGGEDAKVTEARKTILNAVIGVVIVILALVILGWAKNIAGV
jgi:hypothetical protein